MIEVAIVGAIDKELRGCRVRLSASGHRNRIGLVAQTVVGFIADSATGLLAHVVFGESAALNHETFNDSMEQGASVETVINVFHEIGHSDGRSFFVQLQDDVTDRCFESDNRAFCVRY